MTQFTALNREAAANGWTSALYRLYRNTRYELPNSLTHDSLSHWENLVRKTASLQIEPAAFKRRIKTLLGNDSERPAYLQKTDGTKLHSNTEKEAGFREVWENVFSRDDEEDDAAKTRQPTLVRDFHDANVHRTLPHDVHHRLEQQEDQEQNYLICDISDDIRNTIQAMKNNSPGAS